MLRREIRRITSSSLITITVALFCMTGKVGATWVGEIAKISIRRPLCFLALDTLIDSLRSLFIRSSKHRADIYNDNVYATVVVRDRMCVLAMVCLTYHGKMFSSAVYPRSVPVSVLICINIFV